MWRCACDAYVMEARNSSIAMASLWMIAVSVVLLFVPGINGFVGGVVGGYKAGSPLRGIAAAAGTATVLTIGTWVGFAVLRLPFVQFASEMSLTAWSVLSSASTILGALIGGALAPVRSSYRRRPAG